MSSFLGVRSVTVDDVRHWLVARCHAPSTMGSQLDMMRAGLSPARNGSGAARSLASDATAKREEEMLGLAALGRCVSELQRLDKVSFIQCDELRKTARKARMCEGAVALGVLRAYEEWATKSKERGLAAVHGWIVSHTRGQDIGAGDELAQEFREGKSKRARDQAAGVLADALLALAAHVQGWNQREKAGS